MKKYIILKSVAALILSAGMSSAASAGCGNGSLYCSASSHGSSASWSSHQAQALSYAPAPRMVPFTSQAPMGGPVSIEGLGANEFLQQTSCPVNVNGLEAGQKVLGCYSVMKQTPRVAYHHVQVVHPIIYVRYAVPTPVYHVPVPVPTPVYQPMMTCGIPMMPPPMMGCRRW